MKKLVGVLLAVFIFGGSALAFAWWDQLETDENVTIPVGQGVTISVSLDEQTTGNLVPEGVVLKTGDVESVVIDFDVSLDSSDLVSALNLSTTVSNIEINGDDAHAALVTTVVSGATSIQNDTVTVIITVTLDEPGSQAAYDAIINQDITFDVTFLAE